MINKYPVIKLTIVFALGIIAQRYAHLQANPCLAGILVCVALILAVRKSRFAGRLQLQNLSVVAGIMFGGALLYAINNPLVTDRPFTEKYVKRVTVAGKIAALELKREGRISFYLQTGALTGETGTANKSFLLLCSYKDTLQSRVDSLYQTLVPGYIVKFQCSYSSGKEIRNPGEFDYAAYLREKGIAGILSLQDTTHIDRIGGEPDKFGAWLLWVRNGIGDRIDALFDKNDAGMAKGLLLGDKNEIPEEVQTGFINAGVAHVLAVSGMNVAFISLILFFMLGRFSLKARYIASALGITLFWIVAGNSPPVARAALMGYIVILNFFLNRDSSGLNTLFLTALVILVIAPYDLFSPSFQLSFGGVLALVVVYPPFKKFIDETGIKNGLIKKLILFLALTFAAQLGVIPITNYYFGKVSITSFLSNLIVVPLTNFLMGGHILSLIISVIWYPLARVEAAGCDAMTWCLYKFVQLAGDTSYSYIALSGFSLSAVLVYYSLLSVFVYHFKRFTSLRSKFALLGSTVLCLVMFHAVVNKPVFERGKLNLFAVDIGQGDATVIQTPEGETILVDAGNANGKFDNGKMVILPLLERLHIAKLDYAIITHLDADHYKGIFALMAAGKIKTLIKPPVYQANKDSILVHFATMHNVAVVVPEDTAWHIGGISIYFLNNNGAWGRPEFNQNDKSLCFRLQYGNTAALFMGDAQAGREKMLEQDCKGFLDADLLKVAHHGSRHGSTREFLQSVTPSVALISAGERNLYRHPHRETLEGLKLMNAAIYRTDTDGGIWLQSDGKQFQWLNWR